ncbi:DUF2339 domain-containing protein [Pseudothauera rhizosphaerae]|uniref:DUF2339 domain-containing protein n=1 Tax=Pseudothauera rhizosphaerae TaxID=2565932 RepID=A0A4S4AU72_9RHOO|nr:DUF2339 domain-containing protein [Pseudothauera rhizosphaerae]THF63314.1 DUF2339 domain-containing protein [Pseudothauera rhizosphaerae]
MGIIVFAIGGLLLIGFFGGLLGGRLGRRPDAEQLQRIEERLDLLQLAQNRLIRQVATLEAAARVPADAAAPAAPEPAIAPESAAPAAAAGPDILEFDLPLPSRTQAAPADALPRPTPLPQPPSFDTPSPAGWLRDWLFGGNTVVRAGIVILFFGVAFLLKYAYERVQVPIELRLTGVALGAVVLLVLGWRLRERRAGYALALQGGAVGLLYLTVFAALRLYQLIPAPAAFAALVAIAAFSGVLALLQEGRSLAVLGTCGGFLAPLLASTGSGSHVALFSYYAVLNAGVLALAWRRAWRELNLLGFVFTFVIGALWGARYYRPELFASVEPFLLLFFLIYLAVPVGYALRRRVEDDQGRTAAYVDASLVFGVPLVAFGLQLRLVSGFEYGAAFSAVALGALYLLLARGLWRRAGEKLRLLVEAYYALGVAFATLAVPLAFEGRWTAAAWALEAAAILWIGVRQARLPARAFALLLQLGAGGAFLLDLPGGGDLPLLNAQFLGCTLIAFAGLFSAWYLARHGKALHDAERAAAPALLIWGLGWWVAAGLLQAGHHLPYPVEVNAFLLFLAISAAALAAFAHRSGWAQGGSASLFIGPAIALAAVHALDQSHNPLAALGWLAWPALLGAHLFALYRHEAAHPRTAPWLHALGLWVLALVGGLAAARGIDQVVDGASAWALLGIVLVPGALIAGLASLDTERWPFGPHRHAYLVPGGAPLAVFLLGWSQFANWAHDGWADPLPYVPLVNPLELGLVAALLLAVWWLAALHREEPAGAAQTGGMAGAILGALAFLIANGVLMRSLHHFAGIPWDIDLLLASRLVQAALSIFWTLIALAVMVAGARRTQRAPWIAGAVLMGVVVGKLFLVDLSNVGGIERVVSFLGVGVLMLVIGWFAPVPPRSLENSMENAR